MTTEDGQRLEILDLGSRGIVLSTCMCENTGADQLHGYGYGAADLRLCFHMLSIDMTQSNVVYIEVL